MIHRDAFWKLDHLSDGQLLEGLEVALRTQRGALAEIVAHLAEVEERRLHLEAAYGSMFAYCLARLGMSEDEACRRIEVARLARRFSALFAELASGEITLSVALVLKPVLSLSNHLELLAAARGKSIRQARELVAERFPRADAPSNIRKLPERQPVDASDRERSSVPSASSCPLLSLPTATIPARAASTGDPPVSSAPSAPAPMPSVVVPPSELQVPSAATRNVSAPPVSRTCIDPLSAQRYRIQFTADAALKQKLELARDLLRHAQPGGDFAPIVSQALDLLISDLMRRRFGTGAGRKASSPVSTRAARTPSPPAACKPAAPAQPARTAVEGGSPTWTLAPVPSPISSTRSSRLDRAARRAVLERDGLGCSWTDDHGARCGSRAWLEFDHRQPAGKGGSSEPENLRLLCRAHNRHAAEHAYGREHIARMARQERGSPRSGRPPT